MTLPHLRQNLSFTHHQGIQSPRHAHDMPHGIITTEHEQILAQCRNWQIASLGQILRDGGHGFSGIRGGIVDLEPIAGAQNGRFGNGTRGHQVGRCGIPTWFGNGQLFANFHLGVVNGKTNDVNLEALGGGFETFLFVIVCEYIYIYLYICKLMMMMMMSTKE